MRTTARAGAQALGRGRMGTAAAAGEVASRGERGLALRSVRLVLRPTIFRLQQTQKALQVIVLNVFLQIDSEMGVILPSSQDQRSDSYFAPQKTSYPQGN